MMIQRIKFLAVAAIATLLVACGDGGDDTPNFAGNYQTTLTMTINNCNTTGLPNTSVVSQSVSQNGRNITINSGTATLTGVVDNDNNGFTASDIYTSNGINVDRVITFKKTGNVTEYSESLSVSAQGCVITYSGTATKV